MKDPNGKLVQIELIKMAQERGSGCVDYLWPKPGQSQPSQKWAYVKAVKIDGTPGFVERASILNNRSGGSAAKRRLYETGLNPGRRRSRLRRPTGDRVIAAMSHLGQGLKGSD